MQDSVGPTDEVNEPRRELLKRLAYGAPVVLTLAARPAFVSGGSGDEPPHGND
jgi:hypothetical protein